MEKIEIINLCDKIINQIDLILKEYKSSKNWGIFDMLGGGLIASLVKHNKINKAKNMSTSLDEDLAKLKNEIKYLDDFKTEEFSNLDMFLDVGFDNIFSDIYVQNKIKSSISKLEELKYTIKEVKNNI